MDENRMASIIASEREAWPIQKQLIDKYAKRLNEQLAKLDSAEEGEERATVLGDIGYTAGKLQAIIRLVY